MKTIQKTIGMFGIAIGLIAIVGLVTWIAAPEAVAQLRAALVKNVDEPGRAPYEGVVLGNGTCPIATLCFFEFPAVPAGKRLIVTNVSGLFFRRPGLLAFASSQVTCTNCDNRATLSSPATSSTVSGAEAWTVNEQTNIAFEAGAVPTLKAFFNTSSGLFHSIAIQGHLIDLGL